MEQNLPEAAGSKASFGFTGNYTVKLDSALRVAIPADFKAVLESAYQPDGSKVKCVAGSGVVRILPVPVCEREAAKVNALPSLNPKAIAYRRLFFGFMKECTLDAQNRIRLSKELIDWAKLRPAAEGGADDGKAVEVVIVGQQDQMEIWSLEAWKQFSSSLADNMDELMEMLSPSSQLGVV